MKLKRVVIIGACAALAMAQITACGKKNTEETTTAAVAGESTTAAESAEAETMAKPDDYGTVTLGTYKGVDIAVQDTTVTDEEVQAEIDNTLASNPTYTEVTDRAAVEGDTVNIDYEGKKDGVAFDGGTAQGSDLKLGSGQFIDGFESGLIGHKVGETVDLPLTFPENYGSADLAGQAVVFTVKINAIKEEKEAELTDAWVSEYTQGAQSTVAAYKDSVRENLEKTKKESADSSAQYAAILAVIDNSTFEVNPDAVEYEYEQQIAYYDSMASAYGMDFASIASMYGMDEEGMKANLKDYADEIVKQQLVEEAVSKAEDMKLTDADYDYLAGLYGQDKDTLVTSYGQDIVDQNAMMYKVVNFLVDNANKTVEEETTEAASEESTESQSAAN